MGQKVNPHGLRVGIIKDWDSRWYANDKTFNEYLVEDFKLREYIKKSFTCPEYLRSRLKEQLIKSKLLYTPQNQEW
jgi:SSU ribosomal protein S3P